VLAAVLGTLVLVLFNEGRLLYFPMRDLEATPAALGVAYEDVWLRARDGTRLHAWWVPSDRAADPAACPAVLLLHGNAGNISHRLDKLGTLHALGASTLLLDYRGYGRSEGRPNEAGLSLDAEAAYGHLVTARHVPPARLVLYGESLGTAVAARLASRHQPGGLVLEAAFTSVLDVAREMYPFLPVRWLLRSRFDTLASIRQVRAPLLVIHGRADRFFALHHAQRLLDAAPGPKRLVVLEGGHNDAFLISAGRYRDALRTFLADVDASKSP
jgi:hypothetical protein